MQKLAKIVISLVLIGGLGVLLFKNFFSKSPSASAPAPVVAPPSVPAETSSGELDWNPERLDQLSREELAQRAFIFQRDFLYFYYAIFESRLPEIAKKVFDSGYPEKCEMKLRERVASFSREDFLANMKPAHSGVDFEVFVSDSTKLCLQLLFEHAQEHLSADEFARMKQLRFLLTAPEAQAFLRNEAVRSILRRVSPENILLTESFSTLFAARKASQPLVVPAAPTDAKPLSN